MDSEHVSQKLMSPERLLQIYNDLTKLGVKLWLDGGWGVDALLGEQTRPHKDIDFLIQKKDVQVVNEYFSNSGFIPSESEPSTWWHFVLESPDAIADIHVVDFDDEGKGIYGPPENGAFFPASAFTGVGSVNGSQVLCIGAEYRVECLTVAYGIITRTGYTLRDTDYIDIAKLCKKFSIEMPEEYQAYWRQHPEAK